MFRNLTLNHYLNEDYESFYFNLPSSEVINYFQKRYSVHTKTFKDEMQTLAMSSLDIVDAFDFDDRELLTALGQKRFQSDSDMYKEIMEVVRANPLNKNPTSRGFTKYMRPLLLGKL